MTGPLSGADRDTWAWVAAELDELPEESPEQRDRRRASQRRQWVAAVVLLAATVVLLAAVLVADDGTAGPGEVPRWRELTGFAVLAVGFCTGLLGLWLRGRSVKHLGTWHQPLDWLRPAERRALLRAARAGEPLDGLQVRLARHLAGGRLVMGYSPLVTTGYLFGLSGRVLYEPEPIRYWLAASASVAVAAWLVHLRRDGRRLRRFLDEHPAPSGG